MKKSNKNFLRIYKIVIQGYFAFAGFMIGLFLGEPLMMAVGILAGIIVGDLFSKKFLYKN